MQHKRESQKLSPQVHNQQKFLTPNPSVKTNGANTFSQQTQNQLRDQQLQNSTKTLRSSAAGLNSLLLQSRSGRVSKMNCVYDPRVHKKSSVSSSDSQYEPLDQNSSSQVPMFKQPSKLSNFFGSASITKSKKNDVQSQTQNSELINDETNKSQDSLFKGYQNFAQGSKKGIMQEKRAFIERIYSFKMQLLIVCLQLVLTLPLFEFNYHIIENFHAYYKLQPWSFGVIQTTTDDPHLDNVKILRAYENIKIIKQDHERDFHYNMTHYEQTEQYSAMDLLEQYLQVQFQLQDQSPLGIKVDFEKIYAEQETKDLNSTIVTHEGVKKKDFIGLRLSNTTIEHVLEEDLNFIHHFKNDTTIIGLQFGILTLAQLILILSLFCSFYFKERQQLFRQSILPYVSIIAFIAMHHFIILKLKVEPFYHFIEEHLQSFFLILCVLQVRSKFQAIFILLYQLLFWRSVSNFFPISDDRDYNWIYMTENSEKEPISQIIFKGQFIEWFSICLSLIHMILLLLAIVASLFQFEYFQIKVHFDGTDLRVQRAYNAQMAEIVEVVSKPLILFKKVQNIDNQMNLNKKRISHLLQQNLSEDQSQSLNQSSLVSEHEYENKYYYVPLFASSSFKEIISLSLTLNRGFQTGRNQQAAIQEDGIGQNYQQKFESPKIDNPSYSQSDEQEIDLEKNDTQINDFKQNDKSYIPSELFQDLKYVNKIVLKEVLFKIDNENVDATNNSYSSINISESQDKIQKVEKMVDLENGQHFTIIQLIEKTDFDQISQIFSLHVKDIAHMQGQKINQIRFSQSFQNQSPSHIDANSESSCESESQMQNGQNFGGDLEGYSNLNRENLHNTNESPDILNYVYVRAKVKEIEKFGQKYKSLQLTPCDIFTEVQRFSLEFQKEEAMNKNTLPNDLVQDQENLAQEQSQKQVNSGLISKTESLGSKFKPFNRSNSILFRRQLGQSINGQRNEFGSSSQDWFKVRWIKAADLVFRMIPEQQSMINSLINFTEGVVFNVINIKKTLNQLKSENGRQNKDPRICVLRNHSQECSCVFTDQKSQDFTSQRNPQSLCRNIQNLKQLIGFQFESDIIETEKFIKIIWQTAKILAQQVEVESLFMKISKLQMDFCFYKLHKGTIRVFQEVLSSFRELIIDKQLSINVHDQTKSMDQILKYDWNLYKSMFYLQFQCAQADTLNQKSLFIQTRILIQQDGQLILSDEKVDFDKIFRQVNDQTSCDSDSQRQTNFLVTKIFCLSGIGNNLSSEKARKIIRKQANFKMARDFASLLYGNVSVNVVNKISIYQTVLPLNLDEFQNQAQKLSQPSVFTNLMAQPRFLKQLTQLTAADLSKDDFFDQFQQFVVEDDHFTKSYNSTDCIENQQNIGATNLEGDFQNNLNEIVNSGHMRSLSAIDEEKESDKESFYRKELSGYLRPRISKSLETIRIPQNGHQADLDKQDTNQQPQTDKDSSDSYQISLSEERFAGEGVEEGQNINRYPSYENRNVTKSNYIKDIGKDSEKPNKPIKQQLIAQSANSGQSCNDNDVILKDQEVLNDVNQIQKKIETPQIIQQATKQDVSKAKRSSFGSEGIIKSTQDPKKNGQFIMSIRKSVNRNDQAKNVKKVSDDSQLLLKSRSAQKEMESGNVDLIINSNSISAQDLNRFGKKVDYLSDKKCEDLLEIAKLKKSLEQFEICKGSDSIQQHQDIVSLNKDDQAAALQLNSRGGLLMYASEDNMVSSNTNSDHQSVFQVDPTCSEDQASKFRSKNSSQNNRSSTDQSNQIVVGSQKLLNKDNISGQRRKQFIQNHTELSKSSFSQKDNENQNSLIHQHQPQQSSSTCGCQATVLVVEDNFYNVVPLKMMLNQELGLNIQRAVNGQIGIEMYKADALKTCCSKRFILIFMDIQMPVKNGYEATRGILEAFEEISLAFNTNANANNANSNSNSYAAAPAIEHNQGESIKSGSHRQQEQPQFPLQKPVILAMTAFANQQTIARCVQSKMNGILYKPINRRGLLQQIEKFFDTKNVKQQGLVKKK